MKQKNFLNGLQNANNILRSLERSLNLTKKYEKRLLHCKSKHLHSHRSNEWWESDFSDEKASKCSKTETAKTERSQVDLAESWSTMSIVCLQYQYEELSKRFQSLLQAYNERSAALSGREAELAVARRRAEEMLAQLAHAHKVVLTVGEKYLRLRMKRHIQKCCYEDAIEKLRTVIRGVVAEAERARADLDRHLSRDMATARDSASALLLAEIRKCNNLHLENLRLRSQIEELVPGAGQVKW